jgi:hypothetical protein
MAAFTGDEAFDARAEHMAWMLCARRYVEDGLVLPGHQESGPDYASGTAGALDFLIRLNHGGTDPWTPLSGRAAAVAGAQRTRRRA